MATCLCAVLDQTTGAVRVANAGHPPLLRISRSGETAYLGGATGLPLGVRAVRDVRRGLLLGRARRAPRPVHRRTRRTPRRTHRRPARPARDGHATPPPHGDAWCDRIVEAMIGERRDDDVALLGIRIEELRTPELRVEVPAELAHLRHVRDRVRGLARRASGGAERHRRGAPRGRRSDRERRGPRLRRRRRRLLHVHACWTGTASKSRCATTDAGDLPSTTAARGCGSSGS